MTTATASPKLEKLIDQIMIPSKHPGNQKKISSVIKIVHVISDQDSANASENLLNFTKDIVINKLPVKSINLKKAKANLANINSNLNKIEEILIEINQFKYANNVVLIDEPNSKKLFNNLNEVHILLDYISDYLTYAIKTETIKIELSESKKIYTYEELKTLIS